MSEYEAVHYSVLLNEVLSYLSPEKEGAVLVDGTMGEGGHSLAFLKKYPDIRVIGLDTDSAIQEKARLRLSAYEGRVRFVHTWFNDYFRECPSSDWGKPDLILLDLGISMFHYKESGRGFSFLTDEPLDMRLRPSEGESAADIVNGYEEQELADLIYEYGEERYSRKIARTIVHERTKNPVTTTGQLAQLIKDTVPPAYRYNRIHPATKTFQALRIAVNSELDRLTDVLKDAFSCLGTGGKLGIITFHSLEDRMVKICFRDLARACICPPEVAVCQCGGKPLAKLLTRKPVGPTDHEVKENSASRSAKLRVVHKLRETRKE